MTNPYFNLCPLCNGTGEFLSKVECSDCEGKGFNLTIKGDEILEFLCVMKIL